MITVILPTRLMTFSDLEGFLGAERIRLLIHLWSRLLDFIYAPKSTISSNLDLFEGFYPSHMLLSFQGSLQPHIEGQSTIDGS
jgi:hypothetical protein